MTLEAVLPILAAVLAAGLIAGVIAGLLGVGGGIVTVPVLEFLLGYAGVPVDWRMHVAVATSLAAIIPTSIASARAHHRRGAVDLGLVRAWAPAMLVGALTGSLLASRAAGEVLALVFGVVALLVAAKMFLPLERVAFGDQPPRGFVGVLFATVVGGVSSVMGIGGGTLSVPLLTLYGLPIHRAVGTAALFGLVISVPGTIGYLLARPDAALPIGTVGLVSMVGLVLIAPCSMLTAPLGARIAHSLSRRALSIAFGVFLALVAVRMLYRL